MVSHRIGKIGLWIAASVLLGCSGSLQVRDALLYPQALDGVQKVLVVPFENLTPFPEAGLIVADLLADELRGWHGYDVVDRRRLEAMARSGEATLPLHWSRAEALRFARELGVDAVFFGTIVEYGYLREHRGVTELAATAITAKLANAGSGRVLWSATLLGVGGSGITPGRPPLTDLNRRVLETAIARLLSRYEAYKLEKARARAEEGS